MTPGRPSPSSAGEYLWALRLYRVDTLSAARTPNQIRCESLRSQDCGEFDHSAATVSADAHAAAESSRDVSDPTSGTGTLTPGSVTGSLTSRLRV